MRTRSYAQEAWFATVRKARQSLPEPVVDRTFPGLRRRKLIYEKKTFLCRRVPGGGARGPWFPWCIGPGYNAKLIDYMMIRLPVAAGVMFYMICYIETAVRLSGHVI